MGTHKGRVRTLFVMKINYSSHQKDDQRCKKNNLVGNCEHTREGLELARWEKKTHPGHCPVDNDKDRFPFLSCRPTGHKEVDLLVSLARSERMGK